ncbi:hypothetical protein GCM10009549_21450 [Streptomyces thermoalcalitolerans]|uniref:ABC transporter permease n=1 Tax=Streptomyces thermoalcalitolerans TaxID=65605 RepID=A0ABN1NKH2_9ACTN
MTPPQPPHRRPSQPFRSPDLGQPDAARNRQEPPAGAPAVRVYDQDGPGLRTEIREAVVVLVAVTLGGVLLGLLWLWLAPRVPLVGIASGNSWAVYPKETEGEQAIGIDGTFTLLGLAFGAVSAVTVFLVRRRGGVPLVVALCLGGLLGSLLAWRLGVALGPEQDVIAHAREVGEGVTFPAPLTLGAPGALLAWSLAALVVHLGLTALFGPRDPEPYGPYEETSAP